MSADSSLPQISVTDRHLRDITSDALNALILRNNQSARLFIHGGTLSRIRTYQASEIVVAEPMSADALRGEMDRSANFVGKKGFMGIPLLLPVAPPKDVVNDLIALPSWEDMPILKSIIRAPVFTKDGILDTTEGYQPQSHLYYAPDRDLEIGAINATDEAVEAAKSLIFDKLLGEFCFADTASRANALALMLIPFVRPKIGGPTPLHLIDAPTEGSGKGLLANVLTIPSKPDGPELMTEAESDAEWRKRITATLSEATSHILIDNVSKRLDSGSLAAALTTNYWSDRLLGSNRMVKYPVTQIWIATGNNVEMSPEITRRTIWIRLRPSEEDPSQRKFRIEKLQKWALAHRSELVSACLTLIQRWVDVGMPKGNARKGSYEDWATIMSGILSTIGVDGFLGNYLSLNEKANQENTAWREFVSAWHEQHGTNEVGVASLFLIASTKDSTDSSGEKVLIGVGLLDEFLRSDKEKGRRTQLGELLKTKVDRVYGEFRIVSAGRKQGAARYRLEHIGEPCEPSPIGSPEGSRPNEASRSKDLKSSCEPREPYFDPKEKDGVDDNISAEMKTEKHTVEIDTDGEQATEPCPEVSEDLSTTSSNHPHTGSLGSRLVLNPASQQESEPSELKKLSSPSPNSKPTEPIQASTTCEPEKEVSEESSSPSANDLHLGSQGSREVYQPAPRQASYAREPYGESQREGSPSPQGSPESVSFNPGSPTKDDQMTDDSVNVLFGGYNHAVPSQMRSQSTIQKKPDC